MLSRQVALKGVVLPIVDSITGTRVAHWMRALEEMRSWSSTDLQTWKELRLRDLLSHAYEHTAYYRQMMDGLKIKPDDIRTFDDLEVLPTLSKSTIRNNRSGLTPGNLDRIRWKPHSTGGSTGEPLSFRVDLNAWSLLAAQRVLSWGTTGYAYGDRVMVVGGSSLHQGDSRSISKRLYDRMRRYEFRDGVSVDNSSAVEIVRHCRMTGTRFLYGYASTLYLIACVVQELELDHPFTQVFSTSEVLTEEYRSKIEQVLDVPVMDCYGAHDGGISAYEVHRGRYLVNYNCHVHAEEGSGPAILTDLLNFAFPFVRYEVGDDVDLDEVDSSTYNGQVITRVNGRLSQIIRLSNGRKLTGPGFTLLFRDMPVEAYRIFQSGPLEIVCNLKTEPSYSVVDEDHIRSTILRHAGLDCTLVFDYDTPFESGGSGKRLFFLSGNRDDL